MAFLYANLQTIDTSKFYITYGLALVKDTMWFDGTIPAWVPKYPGTDAEWDWMYYQPNIFLVTKGSVKSENNKMAFPTIIEKSQGLYEVRSNTRYKLSAMEDDTHFVCLMPKDNIIYKRCLIKLIENESNTIAPKEMDTYYFIADGKATLNGIERVKMDMIKVEAAVELNISALKDSLIIQVWE
jgi:hypothetical protein